MVPRVAQEICGIALVTGMTSSMAQMTSWVALVTSWVALVISWVTQVTFWVALLTSCVVYRSDQFIRRGAIKNSSTLPTAQTQHSTKTNGVATDSLREFKWRHRSYFLFLDAPSHLYKRVCPSDRPPVGPSHSGLKLQEIDAFNSKT